MSELSEFALVIRNGQLHPSYGFSPSVPELFTLNSGPLTLWGKSWLAHDNKGELLRMW